MQRDWNSLNEVCQTLLIVCHFNGLWCVEIHEFIKHIKFLAAMSSIVYFTVDREGGAGNARVC